MIRPAHHDKFTVYKQANFKIIITFCHPEPDEGQTF
jgi:hypothetical protein